MSSISINILRRARRAAALTLMCMFAVLPLKAEQYLRPHQLDGIALLAPPPAPNSAEQAADLAIVRIVFKARTAEELARATKGANLSIFNFAPAIGDFFQPGKFPKMEALFDDVKTNILESVNVPKNHWNRLRPYQLDPGLVVGTPEINASYPSGHSSKGTVQALLLAELFPEKREAILEMGRTIGWDRVRIGKHFPTDIYAGRVLGQAIVRELMANANFRKNLDEVKKEIQANKPNQQLTEAPAAVSKP
jgi:acid phosphatase (class A)